MRKILSYLLAAALLISLCPATALAASQEQLEADLPVTTSAAESVDIRVTVSIDGELVQAKDKSYMAMKELTVTDKDEDGQITTYDALVCAHEQYYSEGESGFAADEKHQSATKVWGKDGAVLISMPTKNANDAYSQKIGSTALSTGDMLNVGVAAGAENKTKNAFFTPHSGSSAKTDPASETLTTVKALPAKIYVLTRSSLVNAELKTTGIRLSAGKIEDNGITEFTSLNATQDVDGALTLCFSESGSYVLTATSDELKKETTLVPVCLVTVLDAVPEVTNIWLGMDAGGTTANLLTPAFQPGNQDRSITIPESSKNIYAKVSSDGQVFDSLKWCVFAEPPGRAMIAGTYNFNDTPKAVAVTNESTLQFRVFSPNFYINAILASYNVDIKRIVELTGLAVAGGTPIGEFDPVGDAFSVYISESAQDVQITATAKQEGDTVTINGQEAASGSAFSLSLAGLEKNDGVIHVPVKVHREGDGYVDHSYTLNLRLVAEAAMPTILTQPEGDRYIIGDTAKPISVVATASGDVNYQWYKNTENSNSGGTLIPGAEQTSYTPSAEESGTFYYYCVVTNKDVEGAAASSVPAQIIVYPDPTPTVTLLSSPSRLPGDDMSKYAFSHGNFTEGFYYHTGDLASPLKYKITSAVPANTDGLVVDYNYYRLYDGGFSAVGSLIKETSRKAEIEFQLIPQTDNEYGPCLYRCAIDYELLGRSFRSQYVDVFVYVENAPTDYTEVTGSWDGDGTENSPWKLKSQSDLEKLREYVNKSPKSEAYDFAGAYFELTEDITLTEDWTSIGAGETEGSGEKLQPFSGTLDGKGHTLTYAYGETEPLFKYVREATVKNLNIFAPYMAGYGLVSHYYVDYGDDGDYNVGMGGSFKAGCPDTIDIINCTIKSGSVLRNAGFIGGNPMASGGNIVNIRNCTVERDVKIGWDAESNGPGSESQVGSFAGKINGTVINCTSYADVYGGYTVGGIISAKDQSMGPCQIINCAFMGTVTSTGGNAGGIIGTGYGGAPNSPVVTIQNCYVDATITGTRYVGGILGAESGIIQCWNNGYITDNVFYGTLKGTGAGASVGGVVGYTRSLNKYQIISNNYYLDTCGATGAIGSATYVDTNASHGSISGTTYFDTSKALPNLTGVDKNNCNRADDPLGKDADNLGMAVTADQMLDGYVLNKLQASETSLKNWATGSKHPVHSDVPVVYKLEISGTYKDTYYVGDEFNSDGMTITATYSDGNTKTVEPAQVTFSGYDMSKRAVYTVMAEYQGIQAFFDIRVLDIPPQSDKPTELSVSFTLMGDTPHGKGGGSHTLKYGGLQTWIARRTYKVPFNSTVWDLMEKVASENPGLSYVNSGNYVETVTWNGTTLSEFSNGELSGWMYTINGTHSDLGVEQQFLDSGDVIIFHYTDDYTKEDGSENWGGGTVTPPKPSESPEPAETLSPTVTPDASGEAKTEIGTQAVKDAVADAKQTGADEIVIAPQVEGSADKITVELDKSSVDAVAKQTDADLTVKTGAADVTIPQASLEGLAGQTGSKVSVSVETKDGGTAIQVSVDGKAVEALAGGLKAGLPAAEGQVLVIVEPDGTETVVKKSITEDGRIDALLGGSCTVKLADNRKEFDDVTAGVWYDGAVDFASSRELFVGVSESAFAPELPMSRGMLATVLWRLENEQDADVTGAFTDVEDGTWYTEGVAWASQHGIVEGYDGKFAPNSDVTREQLATMLWRYAKDLGLDVTASDDLDAFADGDAVSGYASDAVKWAVGAGLIQGMDGGRLDPAGDATRAEVAMILQRMVRLIVA